MATGRQTINGKGIFPGNVVDRATENSVSSEVQLP